MDVILASSRGKGLEELIRPKHPSPNHLFIKSTSSANLHLLTIQAINIISKAKNPSNHHIYIIGGVLWSQWNHPAQNSHPEKCQIPRVRVQGGAGGGCVPSHRPTGDHITNHSKPQCQTYSLHHSTIQSTHMELHQTSTTQNCHARTLQTIPIHATKHDQITPDHQHQHHWNQQETWLIHTKTRRHHHKKTWGEEET